MAWEPVLDGQLADEAWAAVRAIAEQIESVDTARFGAVDLALFWAYVAGGLDDEASCARYDAAIDRLVEYVQHGFASPSLYGGLAGAGWVLAHISDGDAADDFLGGVDEELTAQLAAGPWPGDYDLIRGLVGLGVYFLERLRRGAGTARRGLALVIDQLAASAERGPDGVTWHTAPELLVTWQRERWPAGYYNLGASHGVPAVIALLGAAAALPDPALAATARELGADATRWLRAQRLSPAPDGLFPAMVGREPRPRERGRTAWCYGDPGIAAALWSAAVRTGDDPGEWRELALEVARRPVEHCHVVDPNLCHGAAGLAHLCNRFYQASGDPAFRDAARDWFERTLAMRRPGEGIAGFTAWRSEIASADGRAGFQTSPDFLDGTAGVALALLAGLRGEEPGWDRLLVCDIPVRGPG